MTAPVPVPDEPAYTPEQNAVDWSPIRPPAPVPDALDDELIRALRSEVGVVNMLAAIRPILDREILAQAERDALIAQARACFLLAAAIREAAKR